MLSLEFLLTLKLFITRLKDHSVRYTGKFDMLHRKSSPTQSADLHFREDTAWNKVLWCMVLGLCPVDVGLGHLLMLDLKFRLEIIAMSDPKGRETSY